MADEPSEPEPSAPAMPDPQAAAASPTVVAPAATEDERTLALAEHAFDVGDFVRMRALCKDLVKSADGKVAARAVVLVDKTRIDRSQIIAILACLALFVALTYVYLWPR